jgi:hypothetical protein
MQKPDRNIRKEYKTYLIIKTTNKKKDDILQDRRPDKSKIYKRQIRTKPLQHEKNTPIRKIIPIQQKNIPEKIPATIQCLCFYLFIYIIII